MASELAVATAKGSLPSLRCVQHHIHLLHWLGVGEKVNMALCSAQVDGLHPVLLHYICRSVVKEFLEQGGTLGKRGEEKNQGNAGLWRHTPESLLD